MEGQSLLQSKLLRLNQSSASLSPEILGFVSCIFHYFPFFSVFCCCCLVRLCYKNNKNVNGIKTVFLGENMVGVEIDICTIFTTCYKSAYFSNCFFAKSQSYNATTKSTRQKKNNYHQVTATNSSYSTENVFQNTDVLLYTAALLFISFCFFSPSVVE